MCIEALLNKIRKVLPSPDMKITSLYLSDKVTQERPNYMEEPKV